MGLGMCSPVLIPMVVEWRCMNNRRFRRYLLLGWVAPVASVPAWATTNTVAGVTTTLTGGVSSAFDSSFLIGITIAAIFLVIGVIVKGVKVYRKG